MSDETMSDDTPPSVTRYASGLLIAGAVIILVLVALLTWRKSYSVPVGEVVLAPTLTVEEARQKVWFTLPELAEHPGWTLEGVTMVGEQWAVVRYVAPGGALEIGKGTRRPLLSSRRPYPREARKTTTVNGQLAIFIQGSWDENEQWNAGIDTALLEWSNNGFHYRIQHTGLGLNYQEMIDFGRALVTLPEKQTTPATATVVPASP